MFASQEQIYTGTDISTLLKEVQKAQDIINKIKEMRRGLLGTALVSVMDEVSASLTWWTHPKESSAQLKSSTV